MERLQAENGSLRERLTAETAAVEDTTRRMAADASRAQRALENKHVEDMRDLSAELLSCVRPLRARPDDCEVVFAFAKGKHH